MSLEIDPGTENGMIRVEVDKTVRERKVVKAEITWDDIYRRVTLCPKGAVWGLPGAGRIIAGLTGRAVQKPEESQVIVEAFIENDDIKNAAIAKYGKTFWTAFEPKDFPKDADVVIIFPWETE